jgi:hypothetical protein
MKMTLKRKNDEFLVMLLKYEQSVMGHVNPPEPQNSGQYLTKMAINAKTMSFWSCLSNMYKVSWAFKITPETQNYGQ